MLSSFPAKSKAVMLALDEAGLKNNWIIPKNSKKQSLSEADIKEIDSLLAKTGVLNPSMDIASRYKVFKALGGKLTSRHKGKLPETKFATPNLGESLDHPSRL